MRDSKTLLKIFLGMIAFCGVVGAASTSSTLVKSVTPDFTDKTAQADFRTTCTYDATSNTFFVGAVEAGANEYAITALTTTDGSNIIKTALTPAQIYAVPGEAALVANPLYNCRVWEMDCFLAGANESVDIKYVAALVQLAGETGVGGSRVAVINVSDPRETYISGVAMSVESATGTASRFLKLAIGHKGSASSTATEKVVLCAVADPDTMVFDSSKTTVGIRAFVVPSSPTDYSLTEFDVSGATAGSGMKMGATASMMSTKMRKLTSMYFDSRAKVLYFGGYMSDTTIGLCAFNLSGSDVITSLNHSTGGTIFNHATTITAPELSRIHRINGIWNDGSSSDAYYLVVQSGESSRNKNGFYLLRLRSDGKLYKTSDGAVAASISDIGLTAATNGTYSAAESVVVGTSLFPVEPGSFITGLNIVGSGRDYRVYVSTTNASLGTDVWATVPTVTSTTGVITAWGGWKRVTDSALQNVGAIGSNATYIWAVKNGSNAYVNSAIASLASSNQASLGLASTKNLEARVQLRKVVALDAVNHQLVVGASTTPDAYSFPSVSNYNVLTGALATAGEVTAASPLTANGIWDMALITNSGGGVDRYYLPKTETTGGKMIVKVASTGTITSITRDVYSLTDYSGNTRRQTFFQHLDEDSELVDSRCVKLVAGRNYLNTLDVLFAFIPDAADGDTRYFKGESAFDMIKVLNADLTEASGSTDFATVLANGAGDGHDMSGGNVESLQCAYWEPTIRCLYLGGAKHSGDDPCLAFVRYSNATTLTGKPVFADGQGSQTTFRDVYQISSLQTAGSSPKTILLINATDSSVSGKDVATGGIYAIPVLGSGANIGKAVAADYLTVATDTDDTWSQGSYAELFNVGGTAPWSAKATIVEIKTIGQDVFVAVANAPGVNGMTGVFATRAVCSAEGDLIAWTPWQLVGSLSAAMQNIALDATYAKYLGLDFASGKPVTPTWKSSESISTLDQLAQAINTDLADNGGVYSVTNHTARAGTAYNLDAGTAGGACMNMVVATGHKAVTIAHIGYQADRDKSTVYNPDRTNIYGYKSFLNSSALISLGNIYCSAMSRGTTGWIFVGGENGVAVLRVPGETGDAGKGWTSSLPTSLQDATGSSTTLAAMTWLKLPGITGPVHKMITVYNNVEPYRESLVVMTPTGVHAFTLLSTKFKDVDPSELGLASLTTFTSGASERVWDIAPLHRAVGTFAVGTTRGLYICKYLTSGDPDLSVVGEVEDADSNAIGAVASISVQAPLIAEPNPIYRLDVVTANSRTDVSKHYSVDVTLNVDSGAIVGTPAAVVVKTLDRMTTQILHRAGVYTYNAAVPNRKPSSLKQLASSLTSIDPVDGGLAIPSINSTLGTVSDVGADGSRLISVNGRVYVQST